MTDDSLLELERAVRGGADTPTRVRYAIALQRAGRPDEALLVLRPIHQDESARKLLADYPLWGDRQGDGGYTRAIDVEPVRRAPRVRWATEIPHELGLEGFGRVLLASPLGVVVQICGPNWARIVGLDPETGAVTWTHPCPHERVVLVRDVVIVVGETLVAREVVTGELLWKRDETRDPTVWSFADGLAIESAYTSKGVVVRCRAHEDPRRKPAADASWKRTLDLKIDGMSAPRHLATGSAVAAQVGKKTIVLDAATGEVVSDTRHEVRMMDRFGLAIVKGPRGTLHSSANEPAWTSSEWSVPVCLGSKLAVFREEKKSSFAIVDRAQGLIVGTFELTSPIEETSLAVARDVVLASSGDELLALDEAGEPLWRHELEHALSIWALAPQARRIYAVSDLPTVTCLEEP